MFQKYGYFDTTLGHKGGKLYGGEEVEFIAKLISGGENVFYCPNKIVYHCIPAKRMRKSYFRKWFYDKGELEAIQMGYYPYRNFMGIPLYRIKWFLKEIHKYFRVRIFNHKNEFIYQLNLVKEIGFIMGRLKYNSAVRTTKK